MNLEKLNKRAFNDLDSKICSSDCPSVVPKARVVQAPKPQRWDEIDSDAEAGEGPARNFVGRLCYYLVNFGAMPDDVNRKSYRMMQDQFGKNIGSIVIGLECGEAAQRLLEAEGFEGSNHNGRGVPLADRASWQYHVVRMNETGKNAILIAARVTLFSKLELLYEHNFHEKEKVQTRILICKATLRKPVGTLGNTIVIAGFHGHCETMKRAAPKEADRVWRETAGLLQQYDVDLFAGDFNMWMLKVPVTLRNFGVIADTLAYYPFQLSADIEPDFPIRVGLDSMAMFWLKGNVEAWVNWPLSHIERLKNAGNPSCRGDPSCRGEVDEVRSDFNELLDTYDKKGTFPGHHYSRYRATDNKDEPDCLKNFEKSMLEFLRHSTPVEIFKNRLQNEGTRSWHRLKQKKCDPAAYHVEGKYWGGAHLPLVVFTEGAAVKSNKAKQTHARQQAANGRNWQGQGYSGQTQRSHRRR